MNQFHPAVQFALVLGGLWVLAALFAHHFQRMLLVYTRSTSFATRAYDLLLFPGIVLHELAHVAAAVVLRVPVLRVDLFRLRRGSDLRQGEVIVARADPLRMSLIGAAPLLVGIPAVLWLLRVVAVPDVALSLHSLEALRPLLREPLRVLGLYVLWAIANAMFPSEADRAAWRVIAIVVGVIAAALWASGQSLHVPPAITVVLSDAAGRLASGLWPVLVGDAVLLVAVVLLTQGGIALRRR